MTALHRSAPSRQQESYYLSGFLLLAITFLGTQYFTFGRPVQWVTLTLLPLLVWCCIRWRQVTFRLRASQFISDRLDRLPSDFIVLHNLLIPAPWGQNHVDHIILSRFGVVVVADGPSTHWMMEQVEAVRSLLISRGLANPSVPVRPLVLLAPGMPDSSPVESDAPVIRVEQVRLGHLAPSEQPVLAPVQINAITGHLMQIQQAA